MIDIDWKPDSKKLRQFALASVAGFPLIALLLGKILPLVGVTPPENLIMIGAILGVIICILGVVVPRAVLPFYWILIALTFPIGLVIGLIALPLVYYGLFTPVSLGLKLLGKDPMERKRNNRETYWVKRKPTPPAAQYFKQF